MITRVTTMEELKQLFVETLLNKTDKVTKVANQSILSGVAYGSAKIAQKAMKDIALVESHLFPEFAYGSHLDATASRFGISDRFGSAKSSTYVRVVGTPGTAYIAGTHTFLGGGQTFDLLEDATIGSIGYAYLPIRSQFSGSAAMIESFQIDTVSPIPVGHEYAVNEYRTVGGRDLEQDDLFRNRIMQGANLAATGTLEGLSQAFMKLNSSVLRVDYQGINSNSQPVLAVASVTGVDFTTGELNILKDRALEYLNLIDLNYLGGLPNIEIKNIEYSPIDVSFRVALDPSIVADSVRKSIQIALGKHIDWRYWNPGDRVEWDDLLQIVKDVRGVRYVPDQFFTPNADMPIDPTTLPRFRGFVMMDLEGALLSSSVSTFNPSFYPNDPDENFNTTALSSI